MMWRGESLQPSEDMEIGKVGGSFPVARLKQEKLPDKP